MDNTDTSNSKVAFVAFLLTFLSQCVDFKKIPHNQKLSQVLVPQCTRNMSGLWNLGLWLFAFYFMWKSLQYVLDLRRLTHVRDFYIHLLNIPDEDMQTITWQEVVARIMVLRDQNVRTTRTMTPQNQRWVLGSQSKERLDASDIANRLMRRENYMIAMINKDILDLTIPLPFLRNRQLLSQTLEWTLMFSILDFVFDPRGQVNQEFLRSDRRGILSAKLRSRFIFAGVMILILSPFVAGYLIIVYFLEYYNVRQRWTWFLDDRNPITDTTCRRSKRTRQYCLREDTHLLQNGSLESSMSFLTCLRDDWTCLTPLPVITSISSQKPRRQWWPRQCHS